MNNVVVVVMDTARQATVGRGDVKFIQNELIEKGTSYSQMITPSPWTLPAHASLFSGVFPSNHGANARQKYFNNNTQSISEIFGEHGYETVAVSNNTWISEEFGFARGFETFIKTWQYVQTDTDLGEVARTEEGLDKLRAVTRRIFEGNPVTNIANAIYGQFLRKQAGDDGAKRTNEWIANWLTNRNGDRPFFLFINYLEPHLEYRPPEEHAGRFLPDGVGYDEAMNVPQDAWKYIAGTVEMTNEDFEILRALYRAEIAYLDERISELHDQLKTANEWEDTIFVVTADHGENIGDHGLMDHQYSLYDTLLHVPLVIHGGPFTGGETVNNLVQLTDLAPTLLDAANIKAPGFREQAQGQSFHPATDTNPRELAIAEYLAPQPTMEALEKRVGNLPEEVYQYDRTLRAIRDHKWKLIRGSDGTTELYRIADDPSEQTDLMSEYPDQAERLGTALDDWLASFEHADTSGEIDMSDSTKERLEDLGYLQ